MKDIADMTIDELNALPIFQEFASISYDVRPDGTVALPNGTVLRGLAGKQVSIPYHTGGRQCFFAGPQTPLCWRDAEGGYWRPVKLVSGEWRRERG